MPFASKAQAMRLITTASPVHCHHGDASGALDATSSPQMAAIFGPQGVAGDARSIFWCRNSAASSLDEGIVAPSAWAIVDQATDRGELAGQELSELGGMSANRWLLPSPRVAAKPRHGSLHLILAEAEPAGRTRIIVAS